MASCYALTEIMPVICQSNSARRPFSSKSRMLSRCSDLVASTFLKFPFRQRTRTHAFTHTPIPMRVDRIRAPPYQRSRCKNYTEHTFTFSLKHDIVFDDDVQPSQTPPHTHTHILPSGNACLSDKYLSLARGATKK